MAKLLTAIGKQKMLVADPLNPISIKSIAIGTGTGAFDENILSLKSEVWRGDASAPMRKGNLLGFSAFVPDSVGGWEMTEWGWIDDEGDLIAYGQLDNPIYKTANVTSFNPELFIELSNSTDAEIFVTNDLNWEHNKMTGREANDAHPIKSITGLENALSDLQDNINLYRKYKKITSNYMVTNDDGGILEIDASASNIVITLPISSTHTSKEISLVRTDTSNNTVTINAGGSDKLIGEGFVWPFAKMNQNELFIFKAGSGVWTGVRGSSTGVSKDALSGNYFLIYRGAAVSRLILESDVKNNLTSVDEGNPLSAAMGKYIYDRMFGIGQTWKDVTSQRFSGTTYTNTSTKPIQLAINANTNNGSINLGGLVFPWDDSDFYTTLFFTVPPNTTYSVNIGTSGSIFRWGELS